jgi:bacterioferritin
MRGEPQVIKALNEILVGELTAINQYFLHARMCKTWGYERLAKTIYAESIDEMKHAQDLLDRVLFLEGIPSMQKLNPLNIGENVLEQLKADLALEKQAIPLVKEAINLCHESKDHVSRELLEHILVDEEKHVDWLESQLQMIEDVGLQNYLAQQINPS